ncbi:MAG TPA: hypothetical protein VGI40_25525 [Pirellulaceae bacterium]|jgi:hypothetical protein
MTLTEEQIKWVVAEVIRRLGVAVGREANHGSTTPNAPWSAAPPTATQDLRITERVVTMRAVEKQLAGVKQVIVQPRAVVTPAVKDELKSRKIELIFGEREH